MKRVTKEILGLFSALLLLICSSCREQKKPPDESIPSIDLKRGAIISCGPPEKKLGAVTFVTSCPESVQKDFDMGIALLHSFEYDEAEKVFAGIIDKAPGCAMAYWGVAMCNYHPLWAPPNPPELEKGAKAIAIAQSITQASKKETAYINALTLFYKDWENADHATRSKLFEKAMEQLHADYPEDKEAAIFYALTLTAGADPADKSYADQKRAVAILKGIYPGQPDHPGIIHYIIHSYDYPELAALALPEARRYAAIAPSSAHAQHMPSHIFTRLGLWDEDISSNLVSTASARCYAENTGIKGHWDEELHGMDYLVYAYLQKGDNKLAEEQCDYLKTIREVFPENFKVAYAFAAIPSRYVLENKLWKEAAALQLYSTGVAWEKYPWQKAIFHFTRALGAAHAGQWDLASDELKTLTTIHDTLLRQKDLYKATQVEIQLKSAQAWLWFKQGKKKEALELMKTAADMEDHTQKAPVTPGEVIPARELLGDMLLEMEQPGEALLAYEADLKLHNNRFNGLYGAGLAADRSNNTLKARTYYQQLVGIANRSTRSELGKARLFLQKK